MKGGATSRPVRGDLRGQEVQFQAQLGEVITPLVDRGEEPRQRSGATRTRRIAGEGPEA